MRLAANPATQPLRVVPVHHTGIAEWIVLGVTLFGALNWGLVGALDLDLVASVFGAGSVMARMACMFIGCCAVGAVGVLLRRPD